MDKDLFSALLLALVIGSVVAFTIFYRNLNYLRYMQGRDPRYAHYWAEKVWWSKFGMGISLGCVVGAFLALLTWG